MDRQEISFEMGSRLKSLREEKRLSYQELADILFEKYGVKVSKDSLRDYEICSGYRSKAKSLPNLGMRTEYLYILSDFYEVSSDYILGFSTHRNYKTRGITLEQIQISGEAAKVQENFWCKEMAHHHTSEEETEAIKKGAIWPYYLRIRNAFYGSRKQYFDILRGIARYIAMTLAVEDAKNLTSFPSSPLGYAHEFQTAAQRDDFLEKNSPLYRSYAAFNLQNTIMRFIDDTANKIANDVLNK